MGLWPVPSDLGSTLSAKTPFPNEVALTGTGVQDSGVFFGRGAESTPQQGCARHPHDHGSRRGQKPPPHSLPPLVPLPLPLGGSKFTFRSFAVLCPHCRAGAICGSRRKTSVSGGRGATGRRGSFGPHGGCWSSCPAPRAVHGRGRHLCPRPRGAGCLTTRYSCCQRDKNP